VNIQIVKIITVLFAGLNLTNFTKDQECKVYHFKIELEFDCLEHEFQHENMDILKQNLKFACQEVFKMYLKNYESRLMEGKPLDI